MTLCINKYGFENLQPNLQMKTLALGDIHCKVLRAFMFTAQDGETYKMENNLLHKMEKNIKWKTI